MQILLAVSAAAAALLAFNGGAAQSAEIKVGTFASAKSFTVRDMYIPWIAKVEKESGGNTISYWFPNDMGSTMKLGINR